MKTKNGDSIPVSNKTLASIDKQIESEINWIREWQEAYGDMLVDPHIVTVGKHNAHLKRLFDRTKLNKRNTDHWKFLLTIVIETAYGRGKAGRPKKESFEKEAEFIRDAADTLRAREDVATGTALAKELIKGKYKTFTSVQSLQNKLSKIHKRVRKESSNPTLEPRLPIPPSELQDIVALMDNRLGSINKISPAISNDRADRS